MAGILSFTPVADGYLAVTAGGYIATDAIGDIADGNAVYIATAETMAIYLLRKCEIPAVRYARRDM